MAAVIPEDLVGKLILAGILSLQSVRLWLSRRNAKRVRDPGEDRRIPPEFDPEAFWQVRADVRSLMQRMEKAGQEMSDLGSDVQGMPERLRAHFCAVDTAKNWAEKCQDERAMMRVDIKELRAEVGALRDEISRLREASWPRRVDRNRS